MNRPILTTALLTASNALVAQAQAQRQPENTPMERRRLADILANQPCSV